MGKKNKKHCTQNNIVMYISIKRRCQIKNPIKITNDKNNFLESAFCMNVKN